MKRLQHAAVVGMLVVGLACGCKQTDPATVTKTDDPRKDQKDDQPERPAGEAKRNKFGLHQKVFVTNPDAVATDTAPGGKAVARTFPPLKPLFVFAYLPDNEATAEYVQVGEGPSRESIVGWLKRADVARWDHRVAKRRRAEYPVSVYATKADAVAVARGQNPAERPIAQASGAVGGFMPFPVGDFDAVEHNGRRYVVAQLHFLAATRGAAPAAVPQEGYTDAEKQAILANVKKTDLVYVIDDTLSTDPFVPSIRLTVHQSADQVDKGAPDVAYGVTLYRDYVPDIEYVEGSTRSVTKTYPLAPGKDKLLAWLAPHRCADKTSIDFPEAGYDGLKTSLTAHGWRGNGLSNRAIIWISDNSCHPPGSAKNPHAIGPDEIIALSKKLNVPIHAVCIVGRDVADQVAHKAQCKQLADATGGQFVLLENPEQDASKAAAQIAGHVVGLYRSRVKEAEDRAKAVTALIREGSVEAARGASGLTAGEWAQAIEWLGQQKVDPAKFSRASAPGYASGWVVTAADGPAVFDTEVFVARGELRFLIAEINRLIEHLDHLDGRLGLMHAVVGSRAGFTSFFDKDVKGVPMDLFLARQGLPCDGGMLKFTSDDLKAMSEETRRQLKARLNDQVLPRLEPVARDNSRFRYFGNAEYAWVPESLLP